MSQVSKLTRRTEPTQGATGQAERLARPGSIANEQEYTTVAPRRDSSIDAALRMLVLVASHAEGHGATALSRMASIPLSTTHRMLVTLVESGLLETTVDGRVRPGDGAREALLRVCRLFPVRTLSVPYLRRIAALTQQTVVLTSRVGYNGVAIWGTQTRSYLHRPLLIGELKSLDATAANRAILAFQRPEFVQGYASSVQDQRPPGFNRQLQAGLARIRRTGLASDGEPLTTPVGSFAVPMCTPEGRAFASIAIHWVAPTRSPSETKTVVAECVRIVNALQAECVESLDSLDGPFDHVPDAQIESLLRSFQI